MANNSTLFTCEALTEEFENLASAIEADLKVVAKLSTRLQTNRERLFSVAGLLGAELSADQEMVLEENGVPSPREFEIAVRRTRTKEGNAGWEWTFDHRRGKERTSPLEWEEKVLLRKLTISDAAELVLQHGPLTTRELCDVLMEENYPTTSDDFVSVLRQTLRRNGEVFQVVKRKGKRAWIRAEDATPF